MNSIIPSKTIPIEKRDFIRDDKYLTFDIECFLGLDNKFNPYSCAWYSKYQYKEYYVDENNSWDKILKLCIEDLFELYPNYTVYVHNLSNFESIFILKCLNTEYKCNTIFKDNRAIEIVIYKTISSENGLLTSDKKAIKNKGCP